MYKYLFIPILIGLLAGCQEAKKADETVEMSEEEAYRPNYHFTPQANWMNDPNGMFYLNGTYHLYFQYYPEGNKWGPMHWGHASSTDLMQWEEHPIALFPDSLGYIFSGSAVVDRNNTSGFGKANKLPVVAFYTSHDPEKAAAGKIDVEVQSMAYSLDEGMTWTKYDGNPVIPNPGARDFRDPKVSWDAVHQQWNMALAVGQEIVFYRSDDLKNWEKLSSFGTGVGGHGGVWECPDLFRLPVTGTEEEKWVLLVSINPGGPNGGSATQYFVGDFDGEVFTMDEEFASRMEQDHRFWIDFGRDNYAGVTWSGIPETDGRKLFIGWMSNWDYGQEVPTTTWRSAMTLPRELHLFKDSTYTLASLPAREVFRNKKQIAQWQDLVLEEEKEILAGDDRLDRAMLTLKASDLNTDTLYIRLSNDLGEYLDLGYATKPSEFFVDRRKSGDTSFSEKFADRVSTAPRTGNSKELKVQLFLDKTSVEVFYDEGRTVMTELFFPTKPWNRLALVPGSGSVTMDDIRLEILQLDQ